MWPPSSVDSAFAWRTIAIAFQRTSAVASRSSSGSPGSSGSSSTGIVLTYGVRDARADRDAEVLRVVDDRVEKVTHPLAAVGLDDGVDGLEPLLRLDGIGVRDLLEHGRSLPASTIPRKRNRRSIPALGGAHP